MSSKGPIVVFLAAVVIVALIGGFILLKVNSNANANNKAKAAVPAAVMQALDSVPMSALNQAGFISGITLPQKVQAASTVLKSGGKPEILYVGAEYCPYCAAERWAMIVALSKFGTFSGLTEIASSSTDSYPNTPTFSFYGSSYTSPYITFIPKEIASETPSSATNNISGYAPLQTMTSSEGTIFSTLDAPPYVPTATDSGSFPFVDFGGHYLQIGASYLPTLIDGQSYATIAGSLKLPTSTIGQVIDSTANGFIASICKMTNNTPSTVCSSTNIQSLETRLG